MDGLPNQFKIHFEIAVGDTVAHGVHEYPGYFGVSLGIIRVATLNVARCLANNLEVSDHGILSFFIVKKFNFRHVFNIAVNPLNRFDDMPEVIGNSQDVFFCSYRLSFLKHLLAKLVGEGSGG